MADDLRPLTQVPEHIAALAASIREAAGDDDLAFTDTLDGETDTIRAARAAVRMIQSNEGLCETAKQMAQRLMARAKDFEDRGQRGRDALSHFMQEIAATSLVLPEATVSLSAGRPSLAGDSDPAALPDDLVKIERKPDRAKIKDAINAGRVIEGYSLSNARPRLQLRVGKAVQE
jgi:hypothetical protein